MNPGSGSIDDPQAIRMAFQRLCRAGGQLHLKSGEFESDFHLLAEEDGRLILGLSDVVRGQWALKPGCHLLMTLEDRGRRYEAVLELGGHGRLDGVECCHFESPRVLKALDEHSLSDYVPERPIPCSYTTPGNDVGDARVKGLGREGLILAPPDARMPRLSLRLGTPSILELSLEKAGHLVLPALTACFGDNWAGMRFREDMDPVVLRSYQAWLQEALREQARQDREAFESGGTRSPRPAGGAEEPRRPAGQARLLVDRSPLILVVAEGDALAHRMAESLGRKFGIASIDYIKDEVRPQLASLGAGEGDWGPVKLVLVHQRQRVTSGLELTRQLTGEEGCTLPILVAGTAEDVTLKRNRAVMCGAVDFIAVEPFNVIKVMKSVEDTLRMFG